MNVVFAYQFEVRPHPGQTTGQCLAAVRDKVAAWVRGCYGRKGDALPRFPFDGAAVAPAAGHEVRTDHREAGPYRLTTLDWEFPGRPPKGGWCFPGGGRHADDETPPNLLPPVWHFSSALADDGRTVQLALVVRAGSEGGVLRRLATRMGSGNPLSSLRNGVLDPILTGWCCRAGEQILYPFPFPVGAALEEAFADRLSGDLAAWCALLEPTPGAAEEEPETADRVAALAEDLLLSPGRTRPVVVVAEAAELVEAVPHAFEFADPKINPPAPEGCLPLTFPEYLQARLLGLAQVAELDAVGAGRLTELVGPERGLRGPGVRIYWPGFTRDAPPAEHPGFGIPQLRKKASPLPLGRIEKSLHHELAYLSGDCFREGHVIRAARAAVADEAAVRGRAAASLAARLAAAEDDARAAKEARERFRRDRDALQRELDGVRRDLAQVNGQLTVVRDAPAAPPEWGDEFAAELGRAWDENAHLVAEAAALRERVGALEDELRAAKENLAREWAAPAPAGDAPEPADPAAFAGAAEALVAAAAEFPDVLVVWDTARRAAEDSRFANPGQVFRALRAVAEVGRAYFAALDGGPPLGPVEAAFRARVPFKYSGFESQTTMSMYGAERVFRHGDQSRQMQRHLTLGGGDTVNCLQIYFEFDDAGRKVEIGYCGRHLPFYRQRT